MVKDKMDPCGFAYISNTMGVIYTAEPIRYNAPPSIRCSSHCTTPFAWPANMPLQPSSGTRFMLIRPSGNAARG